MIELAAITTLRKQAASKTAEFVVSSARAALRDI